MIDARHGAWEWEAVRMLSAEIDRTAKMVVKMQNQGSPITAVHEQIRMKALQDCLAIMGGMAEEFSRAIEMANLPSVTRAQPPRVKPLSKKKLRALDKRREKIREFLRSRPKMLYNFRHAGDENAGLS